MENILGAGGRGVAQMRGPQNLTFEEIVPSSGWTEAPDNYCLLIDLPGFKKKEVKLQVDNYGHLIVSGERQVNEMKHVHFQQSYKVPDNSDIEETTANFEDDILYIVMPKKNTEAIEGDPEKIVNSLVDHPQKENKQNASDKDEVTDAAKIGDDKRTEGMDEEAEGGGEEESHEAKIKNHWNEDSLLGTLAVQLIKNKGIFVTAVLAFSFGVLVSQKFQTFQTNHES